MADPLSLVELRALNDAAYERATHLPDYQAVILTTNTLYIPALEAELEQLQSDLDELRARTGRLERAGHTLAALLARFLNPAATSGDPDDLAAPIAAALDTWGEAQ